MPRHPARIFSQPASRPRARRHRYWIGAAVTAVALASPLAIAAAPAAAQGIQFGSVSGDGSGDLTITVSSGAALTDWTLSLSNGTSSYTMDDFTEFIDQNAFAPDQPQTYVLPTADAQSVFGSAGIALPPGAYTVTATAANDGGVDTFTSPQTLTGTFSFLAQPVLAFSSSTFNTTQQDQAVTIKGQITGCSTVACPSSWSNTTVTVTDVTASSKPQWTSSTTDPSGVFSVSGVTGVPGDSYSASLPAVQGTSLAAMAPSTTLDVPQYAQTSITATATPAAYGKQSITGQLTYQPPSGFNQNAPAGVPITATAGPHTVSTTTGSNGGFSLVLPPLAGDTTWLISSEPNDLASTPFLAGTEYSVSANQLWPVKISFSASLDKFGYVTVEGCMSATIRQRPPADDPTMSFQWRSRRTGQWLPLGSLSTMSHEGCAGFWFFGSRGAPAASAYYRAIFQADNVYAPAVSASTGRLWKYPTRFHAFRVSSRSVTAGGKVRISGTLQYQEGSNWRGYANQRVFIIFARKRNARTWYVPPGGSVKTNSKGAFSATFSDNYATGPSGAQFWSANYGGNDTHFVTSAKPVRIKVHRRASSKPASPGTPVSLLSPVLGARGSMWPFVLSADPWLALMSD